MSSPIRIARHLRQVMTTQEKILWKYLRDRNFKKWKFRRQHPIVYEIIDYYKRFYVADFYCAAARLVIELDGKHHEFGEQKLYDQARDKIMSEMGLTILRIRNEDFFPLDRTLKKIEEALTSPGLS